MICLKTVCFTVPYQTGPKYLQTPGFLILSASVPFPVSLEDKASLSYQRIVALLYFKQFPHTLLAGLFLRDNK